MISLNTDIVWLRPILCFSLPCEYSLDIYLEHCTNDHPVCHSDHSYQAEYINLVSIEPKIPDLVAEHPPAELALQMDKGRNEFRNSQVHLIHDWISSWGIGVPEAKQLQGFGNDVCGQLLCPPNLDQEDPMYIWNDHL